MAQLGQRARFGSERTSVRIRLARRTLEEPADSWRRPPSRKRLGLRRPWRFDPALLRHAPLAQPGQSRGLLSLGSTVRICDGALRGLPRTRSGSSVGRAPPRHDGGPWFESRPEHAAAAWRGGRTGRVARLSPGNVRVRVPSALLKAYMRARRRRRVGSGCKPGAHAEGVRIPPPARIGNASVAQQDRARRSERRGRRFESGRGHDGLVAFPAERPACKAGDPVPVRLRARPRPCHPPLSSTHAPPG